MRAAQLRPPETRRLLVIHRARGALTLGGASALADFARPGDVWVLNDAATLPASLPARARGQALELRLAGAIETGRGREIWRAVLFGPGSWREDTDLRAPPPALAVGEELSIGTPVHGSAGAPPSSPALRAIVQAVDPRSQRLLEVSLEPAGDSFWALLYKLGQPIQYSYMRDVLELEDVQTPYASRPWAVEVPSAGWSLSPPILAAIRARGAEVVTLTHAAGLSATGDPVLDGLLPLPERYDIPERTAQAISAARRVVAVGTSVTRALEGSFRDHHQVSAGSATTDLRIDRHHRLRAVDALLTGAHDPQSSHYQLLEAFVDQALLKAAVLRSESAGLLGHELGDAWLIT